MAEESNSKEDDALTIALHLDAIKYDSKNKEYEIAFKGVKLVHLDADSDTIKLRVPFHRLQRIHMPTLNAEEFMNGSFKSLRHRSVSVQSDNISIQSDRDEDDIAIDGHMHGHVAAAIGHDDDDDYKSDVHDDDDEKRESEKVTHTSSVAATAIAKKRPAKANVNATIEALREADVVNEWSTICKKYPLTSSSHSDDHKTHSAAAEITKNACFARVTFILKLYTRWIVYKDKNFKSQELPKDEDFLSMTSLLTALHGYDKIRLLNDYYWLLQNVILGRTHNPNNNDGQELDTLASNGDILECDYCLNRLRGQAKQAELYNVDKLSASMRRDLYFIHEQNASIAVDSVDERVEIGIQQYLDVLYCALFMPQAHAQQLQQQSGAASLTKYTQWQSPPHKFGEYFTYWKSEHPQYCRAKYGDLKTELLHNTLHALDERDFFCLYNRAKDFLLSSMGRVLVAKRVKLQSKVIAQQKLSIGHVIALLLYTNYFAAFVGEKWIVLGCCRANAEEKFGAVRLRNNEIANWCKLLNEAIFCWGAMLGADDRLYLHVAQKQAFDAMCVEYNQPISTTSKFVTIQNVMHQFKGREEDQGIILRLGKFEASKEYNYALSMAGLSNYPREHEHLIYGGKFEINDIIFEQKTHYNDIQAFKLYLQIMRGRWFAHNKLMFKRQFEKKLVVFITQFVAQNHDQEENYMQRLFDSLVMQNGTSKKLKVLYLNKECDVLLPELKALIVNKLVPFLVKQKHAPQVQFKNGYNTVLSMKLATNAIHSSSFNKSIYSAPYKYQLLYLKNNRPQEIVFHFRCYKKYDEKVQKYSFKACFEIKDLPKCVSKVKLIGGLLIPQVNCEKWDVLTLSHSKLYSGSSLFDMIKLKNLEFVVVKVAFQIKEVFDTENKLIPTIDL